MSKLHGGKMKRKTKEEIIMEHLLQNSELSLLFTKRISARGKKEELYEQERYHEGWQDALVWCLGLKLGKSLSEISIRKQGEK